ncbi:MAG: DUF362 domain-containing protein [Ruminococcaceae bacterium]|nr:DUF362 domain-containing protein [Oscillospiraceae bacterium]
MNKAVVKSCKSYDIEEITACLEAIIDNFGGLDKLFEKGNKVVIKPNLVMKKPPESAAVTHPAVIEALINILKRKTNDITIAECPGGPYTKERMSAVFRTAGYTDVAQRTGVNLCTEMSQVQVPCPEGKVTKNFTVLKEFRDADILINVSKLKSHGLTVMTGTAKNLYGLIPGLEKAQTHARFPGVDEFSDFICDLNTAFKPDLSILDAVMCMEGNGPTGGDARFVGYIIGSDHTYAADLAGAKIIGFDPDEVPMFRRAVLHGLCEKEPEIIGDSFTPLTDFKRPDHQSGGIIGMLTNSSNKFIRNIVRSRPVINKKKCVGCGECVQCCPQKTISIVNKKAHINSANCIYCYCCQELCPKKAVDIKKFFLLNFLK